MRGVEPGVYYRLALGGITGHRDFARDTGVIAASPTDATPVADAIVRVFIEHGDRTNRNKARLKYVLDAWGFDKFLDAVEDEARPQARSGRRRAASRRGRRIDRIGHIGVHAQEQPGLQLDRRRAAGRQADRRRRCAALAEIARRLRRRRRSASPSGRTC